MSAATIDIGLARRVAESGCGAPIDPELPGGLDGLDAVVDQALGRACEYCEISRPEREVVVRLVSRRDWVEANLATIESVGGRIVSRLGGGEAPAAAALASGVGDRAFASVAGAQAGIALGFASSRVLGQYRVALLGEAVEPELLLVAQNIDEVARRLEVDRAELFKWVTLHETAHVLQFEAGGALAERIGGLAGAVLDGSQPRISLADLVGLTSKLVPPDPRRLARALRDFEPFDLLTDAETQASFRSLQAAMSLLEGHAEHVMDAAAEGFVERVDLLRGALDQRRASRNLVETLIARLLGFAAKARQYREGRVFVEAVVESAGIGALNRAWLQPEMLPSGYELADPAAWLRRVS